MSEESRHPEGYEFRPLRGRLEVRATRADGSEPDGPGVLVGTIPYGELSVEMWDIFEGRFQEQIDPDCFTGTIAEDNIVGLFNHDENQLLGRSNPAVAEAERTLRFDNDSSRLQFEVDLPDTPVGSTVRVAVERNDLEGNSFGFTTIRDEWDYGDPDDDDNIVIRTLKEVRLYDVGPVVFPAYPTTTNEVRSTFKGMQRARGAARREARKALDRIRLRELGVQL